MNNIKNTKGRLIVSTCLSLSLFASFAQAGVRAPARTTPPVALAANPAYPSVLRVNPTTLRTYLLSSNRGVLASLNSVLSAKQNVDYKRGALLPSLNITAIVSKFPNFASATVQVLLPFLIPSNWFNLDMSKHQLAATGYAYYLLELNDYASALALYETVVGDMELGKVLQQQYKNLQTIAQYVQNERQIGTETPADVAQAQYQAQAALGQVQRIDELIDQEQSQIRALLGLPLNVKLVFDEYHFQPVPQEKNSSTQILVAINPVSAEFRQYESLIAAAGDTKKSAVFSFITGAALNFSAGSGSSFTGSGQAGGGIGFSYIPGINIANLGINQLRIQESGLRIQQAQTIESALGSIVEAKRQVDTANASVHSAQVFFDGEMQGYKTATVDLLHALDASSDLITAETTAVNARIDLDNQRLMLLRILVSDQFAQIPTCSLHGAEKSGGVMGFLADFFGPKKQTISVDDLCSASNSSVQKAQSGIIPD